MIRIAVILFPGTNCESETLRMIRASGMEAELFRWNQNYDLLKDFDGYVIAGGFSYEDRGRSGLVASFDPIMEVIRSEAVKGKVVLGICNGAQVLVETGMVPGQDSQKHSMCLAWNKRVKDTQVYGDWVSRWTYMKMDAPMGRSAFNMFDGGVVLRVPIAHGEGRFVTSEAGLLEKLIENNQTIFRYCDEDGNFTDEYPVNPNGSLYNLAAVCNDRGNVMAMMPHPERTLEPIQHYYMDHIFQSMKLWIEKHKPSSDEPAVLTRGETRYEFSDVPEVQISLMVKLIITDNEEWTLGQTAHAIGFKDASLVKHVWWGIETGHADAQFVADAVIKSGELANLNKEHVETLFGSDKNLKERSASYLVRQMDDMKEAAKLEHFQKHYPELKITAVHRGILWTVGGVNPDRSKELVDRFLFHSPHSMTISKF